MLQIWCSQFETRRPFKTKDVDCRESYAIAINTMEVFQQEAVTIG